MSDRSLIIASSSETEFSITGQRNYGFFKDIPERKQSQQNFATFIVAATDVTVEIILQNVKLENILFMDALAKATFLNLKLRTVRSEKIREEIAAFKSTKVLPLPELVADSRATDYQKLGARESSLSEGYGLFMEQGTGKTLTAIIAACNLPKGSRVLVVAPNNVRLNWVREFDKFATCSVQATVLRGTQVTRVSQLVDLIRNNKKDLSVAVIGYDTIPGILEALQMITWDLIILDESHYIRNVKTKRWKYVLKLRDRAKRRLVLTGTPIANSLNDLWTQLEFMGQGFSGFQQFKAFKSFFGVYDKTNDTGFERLLALQNVPILQDRLSRYSFVITKAEAIPDLPEKVYDVVEIEMSPAQEDAYQKLATQLAYEIENEISQAHNQALVVQNVLTMLLKLAQITSGFLNIPEEVGPDGSLVHPARQVKFAPNPKLDQLGELLAEKLPHQKTIIWCCFTHDIHEIKKLCDRQGLRAVTFFGNTSDKDREEAERLFNFDDSCRVFIGNPVAGGTGLNLLGYPPGQPELSECNVDHVIYYSQNWSSLARSQSVDRCHRRGTRVNIRVTDLCVPNSIDETIRERVFEKILTAFEITDLRAILKEVLNRE